MHARAHTEVALLYDGVLCVGPSHPAPSQHFQKNFPSLEEREAHSTKRTDNSDTLHYDNEVENVTGQLMTPV